MNNQNLGENSDINEKINDADVNAQQTSEETAEVQPPIEDAPMQEASIETSEPTPEEDGARGINKKKLAIIIGAAVGAVAIITLVVLLALGVFGKKDAPPVDTPTADSTPSAPTEPEDNKPEDNEDETAAESTPHTHTYGAWTIKTAPTCVKAGTEQRSCSCGSKESRVVEATGIHSYGSWTTVTAASCFVDGESQRSCYNCGDKETRVIAAAGQHSFGVWYVWTAATCTAEGTEMRNCKCGEKETRAIDMIEHTYVSTTVEPTVSTDGYNGYVCSCGDSYVDQIKHHYGTAGIEYEYIDARSVKVVGMPYCIDDVIIVPEYYNGYKVVEIADGAFAGLTNTVSIRIPATVTKIGENIFEGCENLTTVYYNSPYESDTNKFLGARSIHTVVFGGKAVTNVIEGLSNIRTVELLDTVKEIQPYAFANCYSLRNVIINEGVEKIGAFAFSECSSLFTLTLPGGIKSIDTAAFYACSLLNNLTLNGSVDYIGYDAFYGCTALSSVSVADIADWCGISFAHAISNPLYYAHRLYLNNKPTEPIRVIEVPAQITSINDYAFYGCESVYEIVIPETVVGIGRSAFNGCKGLTAVNIPDSVSDIGDEAFRSCSSLTSIAIPDGITRIGWSTFYDCKSLSKVSIPASVTAIGNSAFYGCTMLKHIVLPENLTVIGSSAFFGCIRLRSVTLSSSVLIIDTGAFYDCERLADVYYSGTAEDYASIAIADGNDYLASSEVIYGYVYEDEWI